MKVNEGRPYKRVHQLLITLKASSLKGNSFLLSRLQRFFFMDLWTTPIPLMPCSKKSTRKGSVQQRPFRILHLVYAAQSPNTGKLEHPQWSLGNEILPSKWDEATGLWVTKDSGDNWSCQWDGEGVNDWWPPIYKNTHTHRERIGWVGGWA